MSAAHKSEWPAGTGHNANLNTNALNSATGAPSCKAVATQIAKLAIAGHAVHQTADGGYLVCKYGYSHHAADFDSLQSFALKLGVK